MSLDFDTANKVALGYKVVFEEGMRMVRICARSRHTNAAYPRSVPPIKKCPILVLEIAVKTAIRCQTMEAFFV